MSDEKYEALGPLLHEVGLRVADIIGGDPDGAYLYVEAEPGAISASVYKEEGDVVRYYDPTDDLYDALLEAWFAEEPEHWTAMEYVVEGGRFNAKFRYEPIERKEGYDKQRQDTVKARFGNKRVDYGPEPESWHDLKQSDLIRIEEAE